MDAQDLAYFESSYFDLVLFSFNGIDYLDSQGRMRALSEIRRVLKPSATFCFSSHNIQCIKKLLNIEFTLDWRQLYNNMRRTIKNKKLNNLNAETLKYSDYLIIFDGAHEFRLKSYFIRPSYQIKQLHEAGFNKIRIFDLSSGDELKNDELSGNSDFWLYYLCN